MQEIAEEIQQLTPEQRDFFHKRLAEELKKLKPIFEKMHKEHEENARRGYYILTGKRTQIPKSVRQFIPAEIKTREQEISDFLQENFNDLLDKQLEKHSTK